MESLLHLNFVADFLSSSLRLSVPLTFATIGGMLSERSGVYNIGLEGMLLLGAFGAAVGAYFTHSPFGGLLVGLVLGAAGGFLLAFLAVSLGVNQLVGGIAINMFALGLTSFLSRVVFKGKATTMSLPGFKPLAIPLLSKLPVIGPVFLTQDLLVYLMYVMVPLLWFILFHTPWGLNMRAVGEYPRAADTAGVSVSKVRYACVVSSGALAGLGGCYLVLSQVFLFTEHMSAGKGFIALAAIILGRWNPIGGFLACLLFGSCDALQLRLQFSHPQIPYQIFTMLPYVASILALIGIVGKANPPSSAGIPYKREGK
jgi:general nucleoside transport system permease protein